MELIGGETFIFVLVVFLAKTPLSLHCLIKIRKAHKIKTANPSIL